LKDVSAATTGISMKCLVPKKYFKNIEIVLKTNQKFISGLIGKNEVTLEFHQHDDAEIALMEMRFYVPPSNDGTDADPVKVRMNKACCHCMCIN
jgi:hypothetical protein